MTPRKLLRLLLSVGVGGLMLAGVVCLILAVIAVGERDRTLFVRSCAAALACLVPARLLGRGVGAIRGREIDAAVAAHSAAFDLDRPDPVAHFNRGIACARRGDHARAAAHFDEAVRLDPTTATAHVGRVGAYAALGQLDRVLAGYTDAVRREPGNALAYGARATAYNRLGRFYLALRDATEAIRLDPLLPLGHDARGWAYLQRGGYRRPLAVVAVAIWVVSLGFLRRAGISWTDLTTTGSVADYLRAVADFTEAVRLNPTAWDCYDGRARAYRALGEHGKAADDEAALRIGLMR